MGSILIICLGPNNRPRKEAAHGGAERENRWKKLFCRFFCVIDDLACGLRVLKHCSSSSVRKLAYPNVLNEESLSNALWQADVLFNLLHVELCFPLRTTMFCNLRDRGIPETSGDLIRQSLIPHSSRSHLSQAMPELAANLLHLDPASSEYVLWAPSTML